MMCSIENTIIDIIDGQFSKEERKRRMKEGRMSMIMS